MEKWNALSGEKEKKKKVKAFLHRDKKLSASMRIIFLAVVKNLITNILYYHT